MSKIDAKFIPDSRQRPVCGMLQCFIGHIVRGPEPFALEYSPKGFLDVEMRAVKRKP